MTLRTFSLLIAVVVMFDQITKWLAVSRLASYADFVIIPGFFQFTYRTNTGAAWSMFSDRPTALAFFATAVAVGLAVWGYRIRPEEQLLRFPLALILGGAIGNLADRWRLGHVVDFIDFHWREVYHFPTFNVADTSIFVGMSILIFMSLRTPEAQAEREESAGKAAARTETANPQS